MLEVRKGDGTPYPTESLYQILCGLYRHAKSQWKECPNFVDKSSVAFSELAAELQLARISAKINHAAIMTPEEIIFGALV